MVLLDTGPYFREPVDDDIPTDEDRLYTGSDVVSYFNEEVDFSQAGDEANEEMLWWTDQGVITLAFYLL